MATLEEREVGTAYLPYQAPEPDSDVSIFNSHNNAQEAAPGVNTALAVQWGWCVYKPICKQVELPGLEKVTGYMLYHTTTYCFDFSDAVLVKAGYGITVRYLDCEGKEISRTIEDYILFFPLPTGFCTRNFTVWLPNPVGIKTFGCEAQIKFGALLCTEM